MSDTGTSKGRFERMTWRKTLGLGVAVTVAVVLAGLLMWSLSGDPKSPTAGPGTGAAPGSTSAAPSSGGPAANPSSKGSSAPRPPTSPASSLPPGTRSEAAFGFLTELGAIDPALASDRERAIRAGQSTCVDIKASKPRDVLVGETKKRFGSAVDDVKASLIVDAAHNHLCP